MDVLPHLQAWKYCTGYERQPGTGKPSLLPVLDSEALTKLPLLGSFSLEQREKITQALFTLSPRLASCAAEEETVIREIELLLERPVGMVSRGPGTGDVQILKAPFPSA
jgi:hypothetical protein